MNRVFSDTHKSQKRDFIIHIAPALAIAVVLAECDTAVLYNLKSAYSSPSLDLHLTPSDRVSLCKTTSLDFDSGIMQPSVLTLNLDKCMSGV